jgi:hypothetical protein
MTDDRPYKVFSPTKIWMSPTARAWAKEHRMSERDFAKYLIARHEEAGDPFAHDTGHAAGRDERTGFEPEPLTGFEGDVGIAAGRDERTGFEPQSLADVFEGDAGGVPAGIGDIEGFLADALPDAFENLGPPPDRKRSRSEFPFE